MNWPDAPDAAAFHGPAGEFVLRTAPHTEADPMALLMQFLVAFGALAGRHGHWRVEASRHHPNEFCVLVGASGKGRKGSSWDHVEAIVEHVDSDFVQSGVVSGLSSGEGLIAQVADLDPDEKGRDAPDKRRLVVEPEFAQVMKVLAREGNTLSPVVRNAWDGKTLQTINKNSPLRATGAHISIIGHITKDELLRYLNATELANGFFNRFLVIAVQRSKVLPFGGALDGHDLARVRERVMVALRHAHAAGAVTFSTAARAKWIGVYPALSEGRPGMHGAATARAEAHTARLALIYALLDASEEIATEHLDAALAVWSYADRSAAWVFGDSLGDPTADDIWALAKDRPAGISRTEVRDLFSRNKKAREIDRALGALVDAGRLERAALSDGPGRPAEKWIPRRAA
jgi:uncharacterized protein CbrC (UPF0167 family)